MSKPERKPTFQDLVRLEKHPHYYVNPINKKITYRRTVNGETIKIPTGLTQISKAISFVEVELEKRRSGKSETAIKRIKKGVTNPLIRDVWPELLEEKFPGKEKSTQAVYHKNWRHGIEPFWGDRTASQWTTEGILAFKSWYLETHPKRLPEQTIRYIGMISRHLFAHKYIREEPDLSKLSDLPEIIRKNKKFKKPGRVYSPEEQSAMLVAYQSFYPPEKITLQRRILVSRARLGVLLGLRCGMRKKEVLALRREKVDFKKKVMHVWSFKNHKWREVPMVPEVIEAMNEQLFLGSHLESEWVFPMPSDPANHISSQIFDKVWRKVKRIAGISEAAKYEARFHDLRHTFATITGEEGWPPMVACEILDMTLAVYQRVYCKPGAASKAALMNKTFGVTDAQ
jgi:integrase